MAARACKHCDMDWEIASAKHWEVHTELLGASCIKTVIPLATEICMSGLSFPARIDRIACGVRCVPTTPMAWGEERSWYVHLKYTLPALSSGQ